MKRIEYNRNPDVGNTYDNQSMITTVSESDNSYKGKKDRKGKCNLSIFDMVKTVLCGIILILLFIQIILFIIYNKSNKKNDLLINELKDKILNTTDSGLMINKKN